MIAFAAVNAADWLNNPVALDAALRAADAIDVRASGVSRWIGPERELCKAVVAAGLELRIHAWVGRRGPTGSSIVTADDGERQGKQLAELASQVGAARVGVNAERDVWRGPERPSNPGRHFAHPGAVEFLDALCSSFYEHNRAAFLDYLGFAVPAWHFSRTASSDIPAELQRRFGRVCVMAYQSTVPAIMQTLDRAEGLWRLHSPHQVEPWVGVGRVGTDGQVGSESASRWAWDRYGRITFYVGFGAIGQLVEGHAGHRPLVALAEDFRDARRALA